MGASVPDQSEKLPEKDNACDEIVEVLELPSQESLRDLVQFAYADAKTKLARSRANKIRKNITNAVLHQEHHPAVQHAPGPNDPPAPSSHKFSTERAANSAFAVPGFDERRRVKKVDIPPPGLAWVRVQANVAVPEKYEHDFHVPYLGESDAKIKSSNTLAMDLFQQDLDDEGNDSEIEEYSDQIFYLEDDAIHIPQKSEKKSDSAKKELRSSSRAKGPSPSKKTIPKKLLKHAMPVWDRAIKRMALKDIMDRLGIDSTESIEDTVSDVFHLRYPRQVVAYHTNIVTRIKLWEKQDEEELGKKERHAEVVKHAHRELTTCASEVLKSESITFFVCRQCYTYVCSMHGYQNDARPVKKPLDKSQKAILTPQCAAELETKCEDRENGRCWCTRPNPTDGAQWYSKIKASPSLWSDIQTVLRELFETFGHDPCRTSSMLKAFLPHISAEVHFTCCRVGYLCEHMFSKDSDAKKALRANARPRKPQSKWSRSRVRRPAQEIESMQGGRRLDYVPCRHEGACSMKNCICIQSGLLCEKFCGCNHNHVQHGKSQLMCNNAYRGCSCKSTAACASKSCLCFSMNRECDPDLCRQCHDCKVDPLPNGKKWSCLNEGLRMNEKQRTVVGHSKVHGWGVYAVADISKNDIIGEYVGELIKQEEAERRGRVYDEINYSFLFNTTKDYALDSTRLGNKLRYCNHSSRPNCEPKVMRVGGDVRVGLYAKRNIAKNEELFFNYGYDDGPAWAMQGRSKGGSSSKKITGKTASLSEGDSDEVLPVSSRQRKWSDQDELLITRNSNADVEFAGESPTKITRSQKKKKQTDDEYLDIPTNISDDEVVPVEDIGMDRDRDDIKPSTKAVQSQPKSLTPTASGRSVWRGILKRVSVGAADVESPGRRLANGNTARRSPDNVPKLELDRDRAQSDAHRRPDDGERHFVISTKAPAIGRSAEDVSRTPAALDRNSIFAGSGADQHLNKGEYQAPREERSSREPEGATGIATSGVPAANSQGVKTEENVMPDEDKAALQEVFGSDCEVDSDLPSRQRPDADEVKAPEVAAIRKNGMAREPRLLVSNADVDFDRDGPNSEPSGNGTRKTGVIINGVIAEKSAYGDSDPSSDEGFRKRQRHSSSSGDAGSSSRPPSANWIQDETKVSKRTRLLGNGPATSSQRVDSGKDASFPTKRTSILKINGTMAPGSNRDEVSPAKRRLFVSSKESRSPEEHLGRQSQPGSSVRPHSPSQAQPSSSVKRRKTAENGPASSTDDDGTEEAVPVVNLISDEDEERDRNGTCEPNFSNWFM